MCSDIDQDLEKEEKGKDEKKRKSDGIHATPNTHTTPTPTKQIKVFGDVFNIHIIYFMYTRIRIRRKKISHE